MGEFCPLPPVTPEKVPALSYVRLIP
jgi:hypothetical protein